MKSLFRYPGGKNKLLPQLMPVIDALIKANNHSVFTDAFVGGGSVALEVASKYPKLEIFLNDKDYWMYSFWDIVAGQETKELSKLLDLIDQPATLERFYKLRSEDTDDKLICAYKAIFFNRTAFSGILKSGPIGGKGQKGKYTVDCRYNATKIKKKILEINNLLHGRTYVNNLDINQYLKSKNDQEVIYLDPPYYIKGQALYTEFMKPDEHNEMASTLRNKKNWILSYDDCDEILDLYNWASILYIDASYCIQGSKDNWNKKREVLILPS